MVFGFGKKKTQEHTTVPVQNEKTITLKDIPSMLQEIESPRTSEVISIAKTTKDEVEAHKKKIRELILHLESDDLKLDDVDRNLGVIVKRGKDALYQILKKRHHPHLQVL